MPPKKRPRNEIVEFDLNNVCESEFAKQVKFITLEERHLFEENLFILHTQQQREVVNVIQRRIKRTYNLDSTLLESYNNSYQSTWNRCSKTPTENNYKEFMLAYNRLTNQLIKLVTQKKKDEDTASDNRENNNNARPAKKFATTEKVTPAVTNDYNSRPRFFFLQKFQPTSVITMDKREEDAIEVLSENFKNPLTN